MKPISPPKVSAHFKNEKGIAHSVNLLQLSSGDIWATWYQGKAERSPDVRIMLSKYSSESWSKPVVLHNTFQQNDANPVLFESGTNKIMLVYSVLDGKDWTDAYLKYIESSDLGESWTEPENLIEDKGWLVRNKPIRLKSGRLLLPVYDELNWKSAVLYRDSDEGPWVLGDFAHSEVRLIQPSLIQNKDDSITMFLRSDHDSSRMWHSMSFDNGENWNIPRPAAIPNNNSSLDAVKLKSGMVVLVFNDSTGPRSPLSLSTAFDGDKAFESIRHIEDSHGEFSYPAIIAPEVDQIMVGYTHQKDSIKIITVDPKWINERPDRVSSNTPAKMSWDWISPYKGQSPLCLPYLDIVLLDGKNFSTMLCRDTKSLQNPEGVNIPLSKRAGDNPDAIAIGLRSGEYIIGTMYIQNSRRSESNTLKICAMNMHQMWRNQFLEKMFFIAGLKYGLQLFSPEKLVMEMSILSVMDILEPMEGTINEYPHPLKAQLELLDIEYDRNRELAFNRLMEEPVLKRHFGPRDSVPDIGMVDENILKLPQQKNLNGFKNIHKGKRCFILASGPTVNNLDLDKLENEIVIGVNRAGLIYEDCQYTCSMAEHAFANFGALLKDSKELFCTQCRPFGISMRMLGIRGFSFDLEEGIYTGQTISMVALQVAVYLGFTDIIFLGLDLKNSETHTHFFGRESLNVGHEETMYPKMKEAFEEAMDILNKKEIRVRNASTVCDLNCIPKVDYNTLF
jgi:predicted neuraminidase